MGSAAGRRCWAACALVLAVTACSVAAPRLVGQVERPTPRPPPVAPAPAPVPRAALLAAFKPAPPVPPAAPFDVAIGVIAIESLDNAALFGVAPPPVDAAVARDAVHGAEAVLETYLTAAFADAATRFTAAAANAALSGPAFAGADPATLRALGARPTPAVEGVITGPATADAIVLVGPAGPASVALTSTARFELVAGSQRGNAVQYGVFTFAPRAGGGWVIVTADVVLDLPAFVDAPDPEAPAAPPQRRASPPPPGAFGEYPRPRGHSANTTGQRRPPTGGIRQMPASAGAFGEYHGCGGALPRPTGPAEPVAPPPTPSNPGATPAPPQPG